MNRLYRAGGVLAMLMLGMAASASATVGSSRFTGIVQHISTENIKVVNRGSGQTLSFMVLPKFDQVFSGDGKTTYEMAKIHPGDRVMVFYDQKALGMRHADRIVDLSAGVRDKT